MKLQRCVACCTDILFNTLCSLVIPQKQLMQLGIRIAVLLNGISNA